MYKTVTENDIYEAMKKNGYDKLQTGDYIYYEDEEGIKVGAACAVGQAALNLGVEPVSLASVIQRAFSQHNSKLNGQALLVQDIYSTNDITDMTVPEIADTFLSDFKGSNIPWEVDTE